MENHYLEIVANLGLSLFAGAMIGLERSFHGRPAGFRTHALVCLSSAVLMLVTVYHGAWFHAGAARIGAAQGANIDPTRMAQGIMTGIGFLGAGVIMKEGLSVRGLTTAASIWITAAIGILIGIGLFYPAAIATCATLGVLSGFRWIELRMRTQYYAHHTLRFSRQAFWDEDQVRKLINGHGFSIANLGFRLDSQRGLLEYTMIVQTLDRANVSKLVRDLEAEPAILEFQITPTGD